MACIDLTITDSLLPSPTLSSNLLCLLFQVYCTGFLLKMLRISALYKRRVTVKKVSGFITKLRMGNQNNSISFSIE